MGCECRSCFHLELEIDSTALSTKSCMPEVLFFYDYSDRTTLTKFEPMLPKRQNDMHKSDTIINV